MSAVARRAAADDSPREAGARLRTALRAAPPSAALTPSHPPDGPPEGEVRLAVHLGLARVGDLTLHTQLEDKGGEKLYAIEDRLDVDTSGLGNVRILVVGLLASDLSIRDLSLETETPTPEGTTLRRRVAIAPEDGALWVTETRNDDKPTKKKLDGVDVKALILTPPLGVGERLTRLAKGATGSRLAFDGCWDLGAGKAASLTISFDESGQVDLRGERVPGQRVTRDEGPASLESWLDPKTREPLKVLRADATAPRLSFVGREGRERQDLPGPADSTRATEGPRETVLRFLRATADPEPKTAEPAILACLDLDALATRALAKAPDSPEAKDPKFRHTFERALLGRLTAEEWRKNETKRIQAGALVADDWAADVAGDAATVRPKDRPDLAPFELKKTPEGWKITAFPGS